MKPKVFAALWCVMIAGLPAMAQEKLYPVRGNDATLLLTSDRSAIVVERAFQHKLTVGTPDDDRMSILPGTRAPIAVLWIRIQNVSQRPLELNIAKFTSTDDEGRTYSALLPDAAFDRMIAEASGGSIGSRTLSGISLGRVGKKRTEEEAQEDLLRYSLHPGTIPPGGVREGFIYFEGPNRDEFTASIVLGDLWSRPLVFSTEKQKK